MERMQHHVAFARNHPPLILPFRRRKQGNIHIKGFTVDPIRIMEIKLLITVLHLRRAAMIHASHVTVVHIVHIPHLSVIHHHAMVHAGHGLVAIFLHQRLHAHHIEHRIHRELQSTLSQALKRGQRWHSGQHIRQLTGSLDSQRLHA